MGLKLELTISLILIFFILTGLYQFNVIGKTTFICFIVMLVLILIFLSSTFSSIQRDSIVKLICEPETLTDLEYDLIKEYLKSRKDSGSVNELSSKFKSLNFVRSQEEKQQPDLFEMIKMVKELYAMYSYQNGDTTLEEFNLQIQMIEDE